MDYGRNECAQYVQTGLYFAQTALARLLVSQHSPVRGRI